jgi:hypothetical protein
MLARLRAVILGAGPSIVEEVKWKKPSRPMGVPVWSRDGNICIGEALKSAVRLTFPKGAQEWLANLARDVGRHKAPFTVPLCLEGRCGAGAWR